MRIKSEIFVFLIIICILFSMSMVSASEIQDDAIGMDNNYQSNMKINQASDSETITESLDDEVNLDTNDNLNSNLESDNAKDLSNQQTDSNDMKEGSGEESSFNQFHDDLINSGDTFNLSHDYTHDENDRRDSGLFDIVNLTINGNNHTLDGSNANFTFEFSAKENEDPDDPTPKEMNLIINDLTFKNFKNSPLGYRGGNLTLNNVNFTNCDHNESLIFAEGGVGLTLNNCNFYSNSIYGYIDLAMSTLIINNSNFSGNNCNNSAIKLDRGQFTIENSTFENFNAKHGSIINYKGDTFTIKNSKFLNSKADASGGAILAKYFPLFEQPEDGSTIFYPSKYMLIENCLFSNVSSSSDGGAIHLDLDSACQHILQSLIVKDSNFTDCSSRFGGAISILGGQLNISNSDFKNNNASFEGGAIYSSWTNVTIANSNIENNKASQNAGALYFDKGKLIINGSNFINNKALKESNRTANAIYAHDVDAHFLNSIFDNGGIGVYANFASNSEIENVEKNDDLFLLDNTDYILSIESKGIKLNFTGSEIIVDKLPSRFDARDWGWTTPGKVQGDNDDCWAFATVASLETALLKSTGVAYNLSQNYVQKLQLKYFEAGDLRNSLTGFSYSGLGYALSWYGVLPSDNIYDDRGMISDTVLEDERIHVQDAMIIYTGQEDTVDSIKRAIMKYGAVTVQFYVTVEGEIPTEGEDIAIMDHGTHFISLIGWDDNYEAGGEGPDDEGPIDEGPNDDDPHSKFAWMTKDSLGGFGTMGYSTFSDIDYYAIAPQRAAIAYIFENNIDYHVNYQTDLTGLAGFDENYTIYSNEFTSKYDELIGAVGTYFNESGINYSFDILVNNETVHSQSGVSEFAGFRTIVLDKYIPIKTDDVFKVVFKSNSVPYQAWSRVHYQNGTSLVSNDGENWIDFAPLNKTVCLKVYTLEIDDENSFTALAMAIDEAEEELNLTHDYKFNESIDSYFLSNMGLQILIEKDKLVINGNNHVIDGAGKGAKLDFTNEEGEFIINNLTFKNYDSKVLYSAANTTISNVNFTEIVDPYNAIIEIAQGEGLIDNCNFYSNEVDSFINGDFSNITIYNSNFTGNNNYGGGIVVNRWTLIIHNSTFENFSYKNGAIIEHRGDRFELVNSNFINAISSLSGGAILAKYFPMEVDGESQPMPTDPILIKDCVFTNLSCGNDGGAIHIDLDSGSKNIPKTMNIINSNFTDCMAKYGGALSIIGGNLNINESNFINNYASFEGGAIYSSWTNLSISKSNIKNNSANKDAGAIYFDKGKLDINESNFTENKVINPSSTSANAIYAHDVDASFANSNFDNGGVAVYADFASDSKIENVEKNDDIFLLDNHNYILSVENKGIKLNFTNNEIIVDTIPTRFDAREWGWTTPGKTQGNNDDCWAFATIASIEGALLKTTGVEYNLSQNYVQKLQLKYFEAGDKRNSLTGFSYSGLGYALSWYGVLPVDAPYDDRGMIADTDMDVPRIHVQDAKFIYTGMDDTVELLKRAIMEYGAVTVQLYVGEPKGEIPSEGDDISIMDHQTHFVTLIGWDDNKNIGDVPTKGIWITKDSTSSFSEVPLINFENIDYYAIVPERVAIAYIFENNINYHVNYQTDLTNLAGFDDNYTIYSNEFTSKYDELIGAVGTYFNESGINYSFDIFVNGKKVHTQTGISEFAGFRTIILNKYIPIKTGDKFKVVFKSNSVPFQAWSRVHYQNGTSLVSNDGNSWIDFAPLNKTVCLKVYTVEDDTKITGNKNIAVDYDGGSYYSVKVVTADGRAVGAGETVKFTINGKTTTVKTDNNGMAKIKISQLPGKYTITTSYRGKTYKNTVTVKQVLKATKVSVKNTAKKLVLKATLKINGKAVKGKTIKFKFKGKTYKAKTNKKGIAKVTIKQKVIKKLTKKSYAVKVTYLKDTVKTTVKVKQVLKAYKASVKKSAKKFKLKASLKINGKAAKKKLIKFTFKGKTYKAKTNKKGIAKVTVKKAVINKLKKGKTYKAKVAYKKDYVKTTVKVKR